jgi:hypothetical protein
MTKEKNRKLQEIQDLNYKFDSMKREINRIQESATIYKGYKSFYDELVHSSGQLLE